MAPCGNYRPKLPNVWVYAPGGYAPAWAPPKTPPDAPYAPQWPLGPTKVYAPPYAPVKKNYQN